MIPAMLARRNVELKRLTASSCRTRLGLQGWSFVDSSMWNERNSSYAFSFAGRRQGPMATAIFVSKCQ